MRFLLSVAFAVFSFYAMAQTGTITGKIIDQDSKEALIGASALVEGTSIGGIADLNGIYTIKNVKAGAVILRFKYIGYEDVTIEVTVQDGQTVTVSEVAMKSTAIGLSEVEVFANVVEDRRTPLAVSTVGSLIINEQLGGMQLPELLNSTPGVYATQGDGSFGDAYINIRGFGQEEVLFMINGVPMNDMENGIMYWSNFAGLSEVTRSMQVQRGLGASKLAVNSVGGTVNIITDPSDRRKGGRAETTFAMNGSYTNRHRITLNSGELKGGWAFTFQGSRTTGEGIRPGTYVDAWSYFLTASKEINTEHTLLFTMFGAPADRGRAYGIETRAYELHDNYQHNIALGYYNGQPMNVSQNKAHKPQLTLMHLWNLNDRMTLSTSAYTSIARVYGTSVSRSSQTNAFSEPDYSPVNMALRITPDGFQDLQYAYEQNTNNSVTLQNVYGLGTVQGNRSKYILESRYNNHNWYGVISNLNFQVNPTTNIVAGIDLRDYTATHFAKVHHLLGGDFWLDVNRSDRDASENDADNNVLTPNRIARKGDKIHYDYDGRVRWGSMFGQIEKTINQFDLFASVNVSRIQMWRVGNFWSESAKYIDNSFGPSDKRIFNNFNAKAGVNYRINGRHNVFVNGGMFSRAPYLRYAFIESRYSNSYLGGIKNEDVKAVEAGYSYRTGRLKVNVNGYYTEWKNKAFYSPFGATDYPQDAEGEIQAITGIAAIHKGIEIDARFEPVLGLELTGSLSVGDWEWTNNGYTSAINSEGVLEEKYIYSKGVKVGNAAQTVGFIGAHYKKIKDIYLGVRFNYFGNLYEQFDQALRNEKFIQTRKLPDYYILDVYAGYFFKMGDLRSRVSANVHNLLNDTFIRRSLEFNGYSQEVYGFPINFTGTFTIYF
jgi:iron complex outermembrane recepter protein